MSKYDRMIALNKKASLEKIELAKTTLWKIADEGEKVTVSKLMERTGLSRGFFYKNLIVRQELDRVNEQQSGMVHPRKCIMDMAMNQELELLRQQLHTLQNENGLLKNENQKLKAALGRKNLQKLKSFS